MFVCSWVCYHDKSKLHASIITKLQLIIFWLSRAPRKGICGGAKIFGSALMTTGSAQCSRLSGRFFHPYMLLWLVCCMHKQRPFDIITCNGGIAHRRNLPDIWGILPEMKVVPRLWQSFNYHYLVPILVMLHYYLPSELPQHCPKS